MARRGWLGCLTCSVCWWGCWPAATGSQLPADQTTARTTCPRTGITEQSKDDISEHRYNRAEQGRHFRAHVKSRTRTTYPSTGITEQNKDDISEHRYNRAEQGRAQVKNKPEQRRYIRAQGNQSRYDVSRIKSKNRPSVLWQNHFYVDFFSCENRFKAK